MVNGPGLFIPLPAFVQYGGGLFPYMGVDSMRDPVAMGLHEQDTRARNRLILIPACECVDDAGDYIAGQRDSHLTLRGREQAANIGKAIHSVIAEGTGVSAIFCSKMKRAQETADIVCDTVGLDLGGINDDLDIRTGAALNERNWGFLEGRLVRHVQEEYGNELYTLYKDSIRIAPPGGESLGSIMHIRMAAYLHRAILPSIAGLQSRTAIIVAHPDSLRALQLLLNGKRNPAAIRDSYIAPGDARYLTVDRKGGFLESCDIAVHAVAAINKPLPPVRESSLDSEASSAPTEASSVLNTPPASETGVLPWSSIAANSLKDNVKIADPASQPLHDFPSDAKRKPHIELIVVKGETFEEVPFYDAPQTPLVSKPIKGSRFAEQIDHSSDDRIHVPGRRVAFMLDEIDVKAASAHYGEPPLASVVRVTA